MSYSTFPNWNEPQMFFMKLNLILNQDELNGSGAVKSAHGFLSVDCSAALVTCRAAELTLQSSDRPYNQHRVFRLRQKYRNTCWMCCDERFRCCSIFSSTFSLWPQRNDAVPLSFLWKAAQSCCRPCHVRPSSAVYTAFITVTVWANNLLHTRPACCTWSSCFCW